MNLYHVHFILQHYGLPAQIDQTQEECAELIVARNKWKRSKGQIDLKAVAEELADVSIMVEQIKWGLECGPMVDRIITEKLGRTISQIAEEVD